MLEESSFALKVFIFSREKKNSGTILLLYKIPTLLSTSARMAWFCYIQLWMFVNKKHLVKAPPPPHPDRQDLYFAKRDSATPCWVPQTWFCRSSQLQSQWYACLRLSWLLDPSQPRDKNSNFLRWRIWNQPELQNFRARRWAMFPCFAALFS